MNGVHDMGGMQGMGPIQAEKNEPVFHTVWEGRAYGVTRAMGAWRKWSLDGARYQRELIRPADYFTKSYYERWIVALCELMVKTGLVSSAELESGRPDPGSPKLTPGFTGDKVAAFVAKGVPASRNVPVVARFHAGEKVRARNMNPVGHTRLVRYARGKIGAIHQDHGVFVFPDTNALLQGEKPQHVYSVRFAARELWGEQAMAQDSVYIDLWDDYLEPA